MVLTERPGRAPAQGLAVPGTARSPGVGGVLCRVCAAGAPLAVPSPLSLGAGTSLASPFSCFVGEVWHNWFFLFEVV